jgi:hypothetical protein
MRPFAGDLEGSENRFKTSADGYFPTEPEANGRFNDGIKCASERPHLHSRQRSSLAEVQVSHILATFRDRDRRDFWPWSTGREAAVVLRIQALTVNHPARLRRSVTCASQAFV